MSDAGLPRSKFLALLQESLAQSTFVKLTLSDPRRAENGLRNLYARRVELRDGRKLSLRYRYRTRDVTKNLEIHEAVAHLAGLLGAPFGHAHLFTTTADWHLRCEPNGAGSLSRKKPSFTAPASEHHDRSKRKLLPAGEFLRELGLVNAAGAPVPGKADKLRQIERFVEILGHLIERTTMPSLRPVRVLDLACGKGYLTFATDQLLRTRGIDARITGVEQRPELVQKNEAVARRLGYERLTFVNGTIADVDRHENIDLLLALHACDTATDDALHLGIQANAQLILAAPCCHKELRAQLIAPPVLRDCLKHGILAERHAELLTDAIRALLLDIHGYDATVFEFISHEHTAKNLMISAVRKARVTDCDALRARLHALLNFFNVREQRLADLLGELPKRRKNADPRRTR